MTDAAQSAAQSVRESVAPLKAGATPETEETRTAAEQQKAVGATKAKALADAVQKAADDLEPQLPLAAAYARGAAEKLREASSALEKRSVDELIGALGEAARSRPAAVFGVAAVAGLTFSLLLRSTNASEAGRSSTERGGGA